MCPCVEPVGWAEEGDGTLPGTWGDHGLLHCPGPFARTVGPSLATSYPVPVVFGMVSSLLLCASLGAVLYPAQGLLLRCLSAQHHPGQSNDKAIYIIYFYLFIW